MGYAGGAKADPTYHDLGDHTETIEIDFDPERISYAQLLAVFWDAHSPTNPAFSRQYASLVHYQDEGQRAEALASMAAEEERLGTPIVTEILPLARFYRAEGYHQKYRLRSHDDIAAELEAVYPNEDDFTDSTAAMRLNAFLGGYGSQRLLDQEIESYGLSPESKAELRRLTEDRLPEEDRPIPNCGG